MDKQYTEDRNRPGMHAVESTEASGLSNSSDRMDAKGHSAKKHAIIPVFIPHKGCPNDCIFCNQRKITARIQAVTPADVRTTIDTWLTTLTDVPTVEVAFYGGSFTGLSIPEQNDYLEIAEEYKSAGKISKIHLSTRPDYINEEILRNLRAHSVDTIELGVQSFDDEVLRRSNRGHTSEQVYQAVDLIQQYGFELGIQLMIGLPGDSLQSCIQSAEITATLNPSLCRLYPTIVLDETELYAEYLRGSYIPLSREEAVLRTKEMYKILDAAGITIMRVGLKSTDIIGDGGAINGGTYHPAFRQLVEGAIAREMIEKQLDELLSKRFGDWGREEFIFGRNPEEMKEWVEAEDSAGSPPGKNYSSKYNRRNRIKIDVFSNGKWYSNMVGNDAENKKYFQQNYPMLNIKFRRDETLPDGEFRVAMKEDYNG